MLAHEHRRDLDGHLIGQGSPHTLNELDIPEMMAFVWWFFTREADDDEKRKFEGRLWRPIKADVAPIPAKSPWSAENEMAAFGALKAETGA